MARIAFLELEPAGNPIDLVEELVAANDWNFERQGENELAVQMPGQWCDIHMWFARREETRSMIFTCALDMRVPAERRQAVYPLLAKINQRLWVGHFELWADEGWPTFRHTVIAGSEGKISAAVLDDLIDAARSECDRFYPAFQYVIWAGKDADQAIAAALVDPVGEA
ncbi:MAG TPA: YbjN domain-containing protein [Alphaproteobacteria bacterium]